LWAEYKGGDKAKRTLAKPATLGCGYRLGPGEQKENPDTGEIESTGLLGYAENMGVKMTLAQAKHAVKVWRSTFTEAVDFWDDLDDAAKRCLRTKQPQRLGYLTFDISGPFMRMGLPSGRHLYYCRPKIENKETPWGQIKPTITYEGLDDKNNWTRLKTHGGKLVENADQAISRDLLAHGMKLARKRGLGIRLHVHDQVVAMVREENGGRALKILEECMSETPKWAPGLPLAAKGMISKIFIKD
jgi:DNA polymerase